MATSNLERVGKSMELLQKGLMPYVEREMKAALGDKWLETAQAGIRDDRLPSKKKDKASGLDSQAILATMWNQWNAVFRNKLGHAERSLVSELRDARNRWAHQEKFDSDDCYRVLDSKIPLSTRPATETFLALLKISATPKGPSLWLN